MRVRLGRALEREEAARAAEAVLPPGEEEAARARVVSGEPGVTHGTLACRRHLAQDTRRRAARNPRRHAPASSRPENALNLARALQYRTRRLRRRLWPRLALAPLVLLVGLVGLVAGLLTLGHQLAGEGPVAAAAVTNTVFWLGILQALVYCYTTFEIIFRAPDQRFLAPLPLRGGRRFDELMIVALAAHLPLLLPALAYALALSDRGAGSLALFAFAYPALTLVLGVPVAMALHMLAGRSMLSPASPLKKMLAGAVIDDDAALLVYAPALGLLVIAVAGIFLELALRTSLVKGDTSTALALSAGVLLTAAFAWSAGRRLADADLHRMLPRFSEADVPPPFRDDGVARHLPGASLARLLPAAARPYYLRDLRQLRRRYRLDRVLLFAAPLLGWKVAADTGGTLLPLVAAHGALIVLAFTSAFRLVGPELAAPGLERSLPIRAGDLARGRLAALALHPVQATLAFAAGTFVAAPADVAALALVLGLLGALAWVSLTFFITRVRRAGAPELATTSALATRIVAIAALAWLGGWT